LDRAIAMDPRYGHARAWRACVLGQAWIYGWSASEPDKAFQEVADELDRALALDQDDADIHRILAAVYLTRDNFRRARRHQEKALELNPNYDLSVVQMGELLTWMGEPEPGIEWIKKAMELNPYHPPRFWSHLGRAYFVARRYEDAIDAFMEMDPMDVLQHAHVAACHAYLGDDAAAARRAASVLKRAPDFTVAAHMATQHYMRDEDRAHHRDGLIKAGLPAGDA
jgi:adenylate cyclase